MRKCFNIFLASFAFLIKTSIIFANSDEINVLQVLAENPVKIIKEPNGTNASPLITESAMTRINVIRTRFASLADAENGEKIALNKILLQFTDLKFPHSRNLQKAIPEMPASVDPNLINSRPQEDETILSDHINSKTIGELVASAKDPNSIAEPLAVADTLFHAGLNKEAAVFYEIAAGRPKSMGRIVTDDDKSWILLQLAACFNAEPEKAIPILDKLIENYPKSIWKAAAVTKRDILQWRKKENPRQLLEASRFE